MISIRSDQYLEPGCWPRVGSGSGHKPSDPDPVFSRGQDPGELQPDPQPYTWRLPRYCWRISAVKSEAHGVLEVNDDQRTSQPFFSCHRQFNIDRNHGHITPTGQYMDIGFVALDIQEDLSNSHSILAMYIKINQTS